MRVHALPVEERIFTGPQRFARGIGDIDIDLLHRRGIIDRVDRVPVISGARKRGAGLLNGTAHEVARLGIAQAVLRRVLYLDRAARRVRNRNHQPAFCPARNFEYCCAPPSSVVAAPNPAAIIACLPSDFAARFSLS